MNYSGQSRKPSILLISLFGLWLFFGLVIAIHSFVSWNREGLSVTWQHVAALEGTRWGLWILISFFVLRLLQHLPITRDNWRTRLPLHVLIGAVVCLLHFAADTGMHLLVQPWPLPEPFPELFIERLGSIRIFLSLVVYWAILGSAHAVDYYRKYQEGQLRSVQLEKQLAEAQLQALKMQLHPHFLFNTLNSIASLIRSDRKKAATDMLAGLSDLLRLILENAGSQEVSLKQELEFLKRYLEIEQIRFEERLQVEIEIPPETLSASVPNLILQPLVENAIRHGIAPNPNNGVLEIRARKNDGSLQLSVRNSVTGDAPIAYEEKNGLGLTNTRARLEKLYGPNQYLNFMREEAGYTRVTVTIPFQQFSERAIRADTEN